MAQRSRREQTRDKDRQEFSPTTASLTLKSTGVINGSLKKNLNTHIEPELHTS